MTKYVSRIFLNPVFKIIQKIISILRRIPPRWCVYITVGCITLTTFWERAIQNSRVTLWQDETLMIFVANHEPFSAGFFASLKSIIAGMPWSFWEYGIYMRIIQSWIPLNDLMRNLEFYLRFPLTVDAFIIICGVFMMSKCLSRSSLLAGLITLSLVTLNNLAAHLGGELRFHTSGMAYTVLSWCFLSLLLTSGPSKRWQYTFFFLWVVFVIIAGATHIYSTYSLFFEIIVFVLANHDLIPGISLRAINGFLKTVGLLFVYGVGIVEGLFFRFVMTKPTARSPSLEGSWDIIHQAVNQLNVDVLIPGIWFWGTMFAACVAVALRRTLLKKEQMQLIFLGCLGFFQLFMMGGLAFKYFKWGWGPEHWMGRYVMAGLVPFIFFLSYFARGLIRRDWEDKITPFFCVLSLALYFLFPSMNDSYWGSHAARHGNERWNSIREDILSVQGYGKVKYVMGIVPNHSHVAQEDIYGKNINQTWQLYTGGPFSVARFHEQENAFGGRKPLPCEIRERFPLATHPAAAYAVDFCEEDKIFLRIVKQ